MSSRGSKLDSFLCSSREIQNRSRDIQINEVRDRKIGKTDGGKRGIKLLTSFLSALLDEWRS